MNVLIIMYSMARNIYCTALPICAFDFAVCSRTNRLKARSARLAGTSEMKVLLSRAGLQLVSQPSTVPTDAEPFVL